MAPNVACSFLAVRTLVLHLAHKGNCDAHKSQHNRLQSELSKNNLAFYQETKLCYVICYIQGGPKK